MVVKDTKIEGCKLIKPEVFYDFRGEYVETWSLQNYDSLVKGATFKQDDFSVSQRGVLRGLHGDPLTWKLIQCPMGELLLGVLDVRVNSPTKGEWELFPLNEKNRWQVLIPAGCANGHLCLSEKCMFDYKQTTYYSEQKQFSYHYSSGGIKWPDNDTVPLLSERDLNASVWGERADIHLGL
jgi:dTDP-4-dehydrorhamnose 3,5-epimerase